MRTHSTLIMLSLGFIGASRVSAEDIDFNRDVRPIPSDKCYVCHGPDRNRTRTIRSWNASDS